jgi:hypothetical protein
MLSSQSWRPARGLVCAARGCVASRGHEEKGCNRDHSTWGLTPQKGGCVQPTYDVYVYRESRCGTLASHCVGLCWWRQGYPLPSRWRPQRQMCVRIRSSAPSPWRSCETQCSLKGMITTATRVNVQLHCSGCLGVPSHTRSRAPRSRPSPSSRITFFEMRSTTGVSVQRPPTHRVTPLCAAIHSC